MEEKSSLIADGNEKRFVLPPFRYYLVISFLISIFLLVIDGIYISEAILMKMPFFTVIKNGLFFWIPVFLVLMMISIILWGMDAVSWLIFNKRKLCGEAGKNQYFNYVSGTIYYILFVYINLIYFRLYVSSFIPGMRKNGMITGAVYLSAIALVVAVILFFVKYRKYIYDGIFSDLINPLYKTVFILVVSLFIIGIITSILTEEKAGTFESKPKLIQGRPHIIIITLDNVRTENMSLYGHKRLTTPFLEKFAEESMVFENMISGGSETVTSMPCIVTGKSLLRKFPIPNSYYDKSLPTVLSENGYGKTIFLSPLSMNMFPRKIFSEYMIFNNSTGDPVKRFSYLGKSRRSLIWISWFLSEDERFFNIFHPRDPRDLDFKRTNTIMTEGYEYIINSLKSSSKPVFVWAHYLETHPPFYPPPLMKSYFTGSRDPETDKYDACIRYSDYELGSFISRLKAEGLYDNTLIVISSDHGCYFSGEIYNNSIPVGSPPQESLRFTHLMVNVPLIIHQPAQKTGKRIKTIAHHEDIAPTLLDLAGITIPQKMNGESLVKYMDNETLMSEKIKLSLPAHYLYRWNKMAFKETLGIQFEFFNVGYRNFILELAQKQFEIQDGKKIITSQLPWIVTGVYDVTKDRKRRKNLKSDPALKQMINQLLDSDKLKYYETINFEDTK